MEYALDTGIRNDGLILDRQGQTFLQETAKWAKILAIIGLISCALMVLIAFFMGTFLSMMPGTEEIPVGGFGFLLSALYLIIAALYAYPIWKIFQFSSKSKKAILNQDSYMLTEAMGELKSAYKFIGILMLIFIGFYALMMVMGLLGLAVA